MPDPSLHGLAASSSCPSSCCFSPRSGRLRKRFVLFTVHVLSTSGDRLERRQHDADRRTRGGDGCGSGRGDWSVPPQGLVVCLVSRVLEHVAEFLQLVPGVSILPQPTLSCTNEGSFTYRRSMESPPAYRARARWTSPSRFASYISSSAALTRCFASACGEIGAGVSGSW